MFWDRALIFIALVFVLMSTGVKSEAQTMGLTPSGAQGAAAYVANAVDFDASNDFMARGAALTGAADDDQGILSIWFRLDGSDGGNPIMFFNPDSTAQFYRNSSNSIFFEFRTTASAVALRDNDGGAGGLTAGADWHHGLLSWDVSVPTCQFYLDDVDVQPIDDCQNLAQVLDVAGPTNWCIGTNDCVGANKWDGCMSEFYYNSTTHLDMDTESNRRLFNDGTGGSAGGEPVDLGSDGSTPTSGQPIIYLNGTDSTFQTNQGSGGNFTVTGALSACSSSPTD